MRGCSSRREPISGLGDAGGAPIGCQEQDARPSTTPRGNFKPQAEIHVEPYTRQHRGDASGCTEEPYAAPTSITLTFKADVRRVGPPTPMPLPSSSFAKTNRRPNIP
ncbi:hypothetical protein E2C01_046675 [Portunus trituberculatus]|uniref:Uncharacterized protein n=1 Tax=Portunus trituberculatus TaxID=210409 RepID=A0A5B7G5E4_PORTR|nr:hypothetical protein [Portunus trituberculatus]